MEYFMLCCIIPARNEQNMVTETNIPTFTPSDFLTRALIKVPKANPETEPKKSGQET